MEKSFGKEKVFTKKIFFTNLDFINRLTHTHFFVFKEKSKSKFFKLYQYELICKKFAIFANFFKSNLNKLVYNIKYE